MQKKKRENDRVIDRYIFWVIIIGLIILSAYVIKPFIIALVSAFILAYLVKPVYDRMSRKFNRKLSALSCVVLIIIVIVLPLSAVAGGIIKQAYESVNETNVQQFLDKISSNSIVESLGLELNDIKEKGISLLVSWLTGVISYLPSLILSILITIIGVYYILMNWEYLASVLKKYIPFENKNKIINEVSEITDNIVYGTVLIGIIEFAVALIGFYISGVKFFLLLPMLIGLLAFIPGLGPAIVWVPLGAVYLFSGNYYALIGVIITGLIISIYIDTFLRVKIIGNKAKINPLVLLIGILGGVAIFGIFGFIIGPLILVYTIKLVQEGIGQRSASGY